MSKSAAPIKYKAGDMVRANGAPGVVASVAASGVIFVAVGDDGYMLGFQPSELTLVARAVR